MTEEYTLRDHYHWFPESFWEAHEAGRAATYNNDAEVYDFYKDQLYLYDSDSDRWSTATTHEEYETRNGQFSVVVYTDYECGDSDPHETHVVATGTAAQALENLTDENFQAARKRALARYYQYVIDNGQDPLHEFTIKPTKKVNKKYQVKIVPSETGKVEWVNWRRPRGAWREPRWAPNYLHEFLAVAPEDWFNPTYLLGQAYTDDDITFEWEGIEDNLKERWVRLPKDDYYVATRQALAFEVELEEEVPVRHYKRVLQGRARQALRKLEGK